jgi:hypothetical protein
LGTTQGFSRVDTGMHLGSCPEPIPDLYNTILIGAEELRSGSQQKKEKTRRKN